MSTLYKDKDWTEKVQDLEERLCDTLSKSSWDLHKAYSLVCQAAKDELFSLTDVWASFVVYKILNQYDQTKLSQQDDASTSGTNPYPIYAAVEAKILHKAHENSPGTWFEFTPHESGFPGLGAFVYTKDLGSKFENGKLKDNSEEKSICYLQGLWGSVFGCIEENMKYLKELVLQIFSGGLRGKHEYAVGGAGDAKSTGLDKDEVINLIDAGIGINSAYPLVLHPESKVKLILSFDFSSKDPFKIQTNTAATLKPVIMQGTAFSRMEWKSINFMKTEETIKKTAEYCEANNIPFPKIDPEKLKDTDTPSSCYIFRGKDVPTVMHFPLFNKENCPGKIHDFRERYSTFHFSYKEDDVKELLKRAKMNVSNNKERIREEIQQIVSSSTKKF